MRVSSLSWGAAPGTKLKAATFHERAAFFFSPLYTRLASCASVRERVPVSGAMRGYIWGYVFGKWGYTLAQAGAHHAMHAPGQSTVFQWLASMPFCAAAHTSR